MVVRSRTILLFVAVAACLISPATATVHGISVGAIRWDAWFGYPEDENYGKS